MLYMEYVYSALCLIISPLRCILLSVVVAYKLYKGTRQSSRDAQYSLSSFGFCPGSGQNRVNMGKIRQNRAKWGIKKETRYNIFIA